MIDEESVALRVATVEGDTYVLECPRDDCDRRVAITLGKNRPSVEFLKKGSRWHRHHYGMGIEMGGVQVGTGEGTGSERVQ
jgi:hypothetical protein